MLGGCSEGREGGGVSFGTARHHAAAEEKVVSETSVEPLRIVVVTNLWPSARRPAWGSFVANRVDALRRLGQDVRVVAVHDHPSGVARYASLLGRVVQAAGSGRKARTVVEAHIAYPTGVLALPLARVLKAPLVLFAHGSDVLRLPDRSGADQALCRAVFERAALVVANSSYLAGEVRSRLGVDEERIALVPPGIRYGEFAAARRDADRSGDRANDVLFVANLIRRKGCDVLIDALAELKRQGAEVPRLRVVGDGEERDRLVAQAAAASVEVDFLGALPQEGVIREMAAAEVVAVPSREEALGLAALEAMAAGSVPVVSAIGGLAESVKDGVQGFSCRPEDPADLAAALLRARETVRDPARRAEVLVAADAEARPHDVDAVTARTLTAFRRLVETG
jgi:glycosyltransferase involved in cell wall biosynthesis